MSLEEQFRTFIKLEKSDKLLSFLKTLVPDERKSIAPLVKKMYDEYHKYGDIGNGRWGHFFGTERQRTMLSIASFICLDRKQFEKTTYPAGIIKEETLKPILDWYVPEWFSDFVNNEGRSDFVSFDYIWLMSLQKRGILRLSRELIVKILPGTTTEFHPGIGYRYKPEKLLVYPETLNEHIWYLFETESTVHFAGRYVNFGKEGKEDNSEWNTIIKNYAAEGKIDRQRLLRESLLASNKNFNKVSSGWFIQLFSDLAPTSDELLMLQRDLIGVLNSPHSKVVNSALQLIKKIVTDSRFDYEAFVNTAMMLLTSSTKATVTSALILAEKVAKKRKDLRAKIATAVCQVFIHPDEELQMKGAKLLVGLADTENSDINTTLEHYRESLLSGPKKILEPLLTHEPEINPLMTASRQELFTEKRKLVPIPEISTIDDLAFLASHAFDNHHPIHFEQLVASILEFSPKIKSSHLPLLEPGFQRALKIAKGDLRSNMGFLESLLANFVVDFANHLADSLPEDTEPLTTLIKKFDYKIGDVTHSWRVMPSGSSYTALWDSDSTPKTYQLFKRLLLIVLSKIRSNETLPLLCTPVYEQGWISPEILIKRLSEYQQKDIEPDAIDLQIAISRCYLDNVDGSRQTSLANLSGEYRNLMHFLLNNEAEPAGPFKYQEAWRVASAVKKANDPDYNLTWEVVEEEHVYDRFNYETRAYEKLTGHRKVLRVVNKANKKKEITGIKKLFSVFATKKADEPFLFDWLTLNSRYLFHEHNDIKRFFLLCPNWPEPMLAEVINRCLGSPVHSGETSKKLVIATLELLLDLLDDFSEIGHLFVGVCLINSDKTVSNLAAEIWIKAVNNNKIDNEKIGEIIGKHQRIEFVPLKRFTDLAIKQLRGISSVHNKALIVVIENILKQLPDTPVMHLKKLIEIYFELLSTTKSEVSQPEITQRFDIWKRTSGLEKAISKF